MINTSQNNEYTYTASACNDGFVRTPAAESCATTTVPADKCFFTSKNHFESSSAVLVSTYCQLLISTLVSESEYTAIGASTDGK